MFVAQAVQGIERCSAEVVGAEVVDEWHPHRVERPTAAATSDVSTDLERVGCSANPKAATTEPAVCVSAGP